MDVIKSKFTNISSDVTRNILEKISENTASLNYERVTWDAKLQNS